jgi:hypothetical protein
VSLLEEEHTGIYRAAILFCMQVHCDVALSVCAMLQYRTKHLIHEEESGPIYFAGGFDRSNLPQV